MNPPKPTQKPKEVIIAGHRRMDPYHWIYEQRVNDPEVLEYLNAENNYADTILEPTKELQEELYNEMRARIDRQDVSVPEKIGEYYYYSRIEKGEQYRRHCRKKGSLEDGQEEVILDENELAKGHPHFNLEVFSVSPNHKLLAYSTDTEGKEHNIIQIKNLETGELLSDRIENCGASFAWANDNRTFFYDHVDPKSNRWDKAHKHTLGTPADQDTIVYEELNDHLYVYTSRSRSGQFIFIKTGLKTPSRLSEVRFLNADQPEGEFTLIQPRERDLQYDIDHIDGDSFYIWTNADDARNFKIVQAPVATPGKEHWEDFIPYEPQVAINEIVGFENHLAISTRRNGLPAILVHDLTSKESHWVDLEEPICAISVTQNPEFRTNVFRFTYSTFTTPRRVYDYNMDSRQIDLKQETLVLGGYNQSDYLSERVFATAVDGTKIPILLFYRRGLKMDGTAPLWLYGHGAYGRIFDAAFNSNRISLIDRGFIYGIPQVRGGGAMGYAWHEDGKLLKKMNSFTDFIRCTEFLISQGYAARDKITIQGASVGGLLVGAVMNMRPDLFTTVIARVPSVDPISAMADSSIPLAGYKAEEFGNLENYYDAIAEYAAYDNAIVEGKRANLFVILALNDPRAEPWQGAKWFAKQREHSEASEGRSTLIMKTKMAPGGHFGPSGRFNALQEIAMQYGFAIQMNQKLRVSLVEVEVPLEPQAVEHGRLQRKSLAEIAHNASQGVREFVRRPIQKAAELQRRARQRRRQ